MIKVASLVLDAYDDVDCRLARQLPASLHACKVADAAEIYDLPDTQFGLVMKTAQGRLVRRFPLHEPDAAKLSHAYFERTRENLPKEAQAVAEAKIAKVVAAYTANEQPAFGATAFVDLTKLVQPMKVASETQVWGLSVGSRNLFPLHNVTLVKTALAAFDRTCCDLEPHHAFEYARNLVKVAEANQVPVDSQHGVHRYTNEGLNLLAFAIALDQRKVAASAAGIATDVLDRLADAAGIIHHRTATESDDAYELRQVKAASADLDPGVLIATLQSFDKAAGVTRRDYLKGMLDPWAAVFSKSAESSQAVVDGVDLSSILPEQLSASFEPQFVQAFLANPVEVYQSSPEPVKNVILGLASTGGVPAPGRPVTTNRPPTGAEAPPAQPVPAQPLDQLSPTYANGPAITN